MVFCPAFFELHPYPYKEYSSWLLVHILREGKLDGTPFYKQLVDTLFNTENQTVLRNVANCLNEIVLQEYRESELIDRLIAFLNDASNKVALHMLAINLLMKFCVKYPELATESATSHSSKCRREITCLQSSDA